MHRTSSVRSALHVALAALLLNVASGWAACCLPDAPAHGADKVATPAVAPCHAKAESSQPERPDTPPGGDCCQMCVPVALATAFGAPATPSVSAASPEALPALAVHTTEPPFRPPIARLS